MFTTMCCLQFETLLLLFALKLVILLRCVTIEYKYVVKQA
jgi:hypothetical protein